jgi:Glycosyltransferase
MKYDVEDRFFPHYADAEVGPTLSSLSSSPPVTRRIALVGCFRPRRCGIATYTADIFDHLTREHPDIAIDIYALRANRADPSDADVTCLIEAEDPASYRAAAKAINRSGVDAVWIQHEFGIFGGPAGAMLLDLVERIAAPLIVTLHTVLAAPSAEQRRIMDVLVARASRLMVMSDYGRQVLIETYGASPDAVTLIEHGTPVRPFAERSPLRAELGIGDRPILSTFGLLGPGKGLETAIRALPAIVARHPDILYRIVGATHPNLIAAEGEAYRESLQALAEDLGVGANIGWDNRFLETEDLLDQIELCDIYLAPYPNLAQVTSGTLSYAVALGRAVISTPFVHARELLSNDVGLLVPQGDSTAIADAVLGLLESADKRRAMQRRAYERGRRTAWPQIVGQCAALLDMAITAPPHISSTRRTAPSLSGVAAMCDDVGILQHGRGVVPDRDHGYCIDDVARALILVNSLGGQIAPEWESRAVRFAAFIQHAWNPDEGAFRNFMSYDRRWLEDRGSDDSNGRAIWALGHCAAHARSNELAGWARDWFDRSARAVAEVRSPRTVAFAMLGAAEVLGRFPSDVAASEILGCGAAYLEKLRSHAARDDWEWFEPTLAYDNARMCEALLRAGTILKVAAWQEAGLETLGWLCEQQTASTGCFRPVGSEGFGRSHDLLPFDQQPLEAWATIAACGAAFLASHDERWRRYAEAAWSWFFGANDRGEALASTETGRCHDGLTPRGINRNVGAESTLAFHLAYQAMDALIWSRGARKDVEFVHADLQT